MKFLGTILLATCLTFTAHAGEAKQADKMTVAEMHEAMSTSDTEVLHWFQIYISGVAKGAMLAELTDYRKDAGHELGGKLWEQNCPVELSAEDMWEVTRKVSKLANINASYAIAITVDILCHRKENKG